MNAMGAAVTPIMSFIISIAVANLPTHAIFLGTGILDLGVCLYLVFSHILIDILYEKADTSEHEFAK